MKRGKNPKFGDIIVVKAGRRRMEYNNIKPETKFVVVKIYPRGSDPDFVGVVAKELDKDSNILKGGMVLDYSTGAAFPHEYAKVIGNMAEKLREMPPTIKTKIMLEEPNWKALIKVDRVFIRQKVTGELSVGDRVEVISPKGD